MHYGNACFGSRRRFRGSFSDQPHFFHQLKQFQLCHQCAGFFTVYRTNSIVGQFSVNGGFGVNFSQIIAEERAVLSFGQLFPHGRFQIQFVQMIINVANGAVFSNQVTGTLLPNACHTGNIIGAIPHQCFDINELQRCHTVFLFDFLLVIHGCLGLSELCSCQAHRDIAANQLQAVPISGGKNTAIARLPTGFRQGSQNIVGFVSLTLYQGISQISQQFLQDGHLLRQLRRHSFSSCLVAVVYLMAESRRFQIKCNRHTIRRFFLHYLIHHDQKTVDGVGV